MCAEKKTTSWKLGMSMSALPFFLAGCGYSIFSWQNSITSVTSSPPGHLKVAFMNPLTSNLVDADSGTTLPTMETTPSVRPDSEGMPFDFNSGQASCPGHDMDYVFELKNNGQSDLEKTASDAVQVQKTTSNPSLRNPVDFVFSIVQQPQLPLAPGGTTTFTVRLSNAANSYCALSAASSSYGFTIESAKVTLHLNDPDNLDYFMNLNVYGGS